MKEYLKKIITRIPVEYKTEFEKEILKDNFQRLSYICILLFLIELLLYFFGERLLDTGRLIQIFLVFDIIMIPTVWYLYKKLSRMNVIILKSVQILYSLSLLFFGICLTYVAQQTTDLVHMYFMMVLGVSLILYMMPVENLILLTSTLILFLVFLPRYQKDIDIVFVIQTNSILVNFFAWLIGRSILQIRLQLFLDRKIIEEKNKELEKMVTRDSMTKLYNHETAFSILKDEIEMCCGKRPLSVMIADIDDFKSINDTYGHLAGDKVIITVANAITAVVRASDRVCRYGGEEFLIVMPDTDLKSAFNCAKRISDSLGAALYGIDVHPTISSGISQYHGETIDELIMKTDNKLYKAKQLGKNRFE